MKRTFSLAAATLLCATAAVPAGNAWAVSDNPHGTGCVNQTWRDAEQVGPSRFDGIGPVAGKRNGSSVASTLSYQLSTNETAETTLSAGAEISLEGAIATVKSTLGVSLSRSVTAGRTWTDTVVVPAGQWGYDQPAVEYRTYELTQYRVGSNCQQTERMIGYVCGIYAAPVFLSCTSKTQSACRVRP